MFLERDLEEQDRRISLTQDGWDAGVFTVT